MTRRNGSALCPRSQDFDFGAMHNGVSCIESLSEGDRGTARQYRFTAAMLSACFGTGIDTIRRRLETLENTGDLNETQNCVSLNVPNQNGNGAVKTMLYDLEAFNKLAMTFIDNPRAVQIRCAFNDVLVKHETGTSSVPMDYEAALVELLARVRENKRLEAERDEAIRSKYHFVEGRDAEMCGRVGGLRKENERLRTENGDSKNWKRVRAIKWLPDYFTLSDGLYVAVAYRLKAICRELDIAPRDIEDSQYGTVKIYPVKAIEILHERIHKDDNMLKKFRKEDDV